MKICSLTRHIRVLPHVAIEKIFAAYDKAGGYPDGAARILGVERSTLFKWNRRLGITNMIRRRTGHYPGWRGNQREVQRPYTNGRRPHRSAAELDARFCT